MYLDKTYTQLLYHSRGTHNCFSTQGVKSLLVCFVNDSTAKIDKKMLCNEVLVLYYQLLNIWGVCIILLLWNSVFVSFGFFCCR